MFSKTKIGTIVWIQLAKASHAVFIIAKTMNPVKMIALGNSKWTLMIAHARFVYKVILPAYIFYFRPIANQDARASPMNALILQLRQSPPPPL